MPLAVRITDIAKKYTIGVGRTSDSLREAITSTVLRREKRAATAEETVWALDGVSFDVQKGEVVGIIGRNGAGKSTLLKILSRITHPTRGQIDVYGSMASLLEVGTGFHPELTGKENIFLNGAILGMTRERILQKFDEIVAFADIGKFLGTPVKHYSSGMYVRLAFAVAAHLDIDLLVIDEVLAVGDVQFQKKCLAKLGDTSQSGRTVIFVSHNMLAVRQLCSRAILIDHGKVLQDGPTIQTLRAFNESLKESEIDAESDAKRRFEGLSAAVRFTSYRVEGVDGQPRYDFKTGESLRVRCTYEVFEPVENLVISFTLQSDVTHEHMTAVRYVLSDYPMKPGQKGSALIELKNLPLLSRDFLPYLWIGSKDGHPYDRLDYRCTNTPPIGFTTDLDPLRYPAGYFAVDSRLILEDTSAAMART